MTAAQTDDNLSFGTWVQQRRLALDLTRPALAQRVHCSPSTIKKIERDERRPSPPVAELLAVHLLIPEHDRTHFLAMADGSFVATPLAAPHLVSMPSFLWAPEEEAPDHLPRPVAREGELAWLAARLEAALAGEGSIAFISGEAGDGKTMLAQEFVRQSQAAHAGLVAAGGNCNAYTGAGDPYLPFREILELLTGDIEGPWRAGAMARTHAMRLWRSVPHAVQAIVETGPDLVETFLCGGALLTRATAATSGCHEQLDRLQALVARRQARQPAAPLYQSNLFAQYTRVLQHLARHAPLLLLVDDLQWADAGSIGLLFHLSRHLRGQRILLVGNYRAAEVALGHAGERHPLEPLLNEVQRTFGEIHVRLNQADGRRFVDALVDSAPNRLGTAFRDALYRQTGGHPLFTVELLHGLQARGDLVRNAAGQWVESPVLAWEIVPARVEGIIKERIGRLPTPLQAFLEAASVAGESFGAEVVAEMLGRDEGQTIASCGAELDRQHQLVVVQGSQPAGEGHLSVYRFRHILFQQYLYNGLDAMQRTRLHRAMAATLARRYGAQTHLIAPQLARHHAIAGDGEQAVRYFTVAGDSAAALYANTEAAAHYRRALALARAAGNGAGAQLGRLYLQLGRALELGAHYDQAIAIYAEMETAARTRNDRAMELASLLARATIRTTVNFARNPARGQILLERARDLAIELGDQAAEARILWNLLILSAYTGGDCAQRLAYGEQALALVRRLDRPEQLAFTLHDIFYAYAGSGQWRRAEESLTEARTLWQTLGNLPMLSETLMRLHWIYLVTGRYEQAALYAEEAFRLGRESHNLDAQALSHFMIGFVHWERGEIDPALAIMEEDIAIAQSVNSLTPLTGTQADLGLLYGELGDFDRGLALAERAYATATEQLPILACWSLAVLVMLHLRRGDCAAAAKRMASLTDYRTLMAQFGYMPFMWVRVGLAQGEVALASGEPKQAAALMTELYADLDAAGLWYLRPDVLHLKGRALLRQGHLDEAQAVLEDARSAAETIGSQRALRPILLSLAEAARQRDDSDGANHASIRTSPG